MRAPIQVDINAYIKSGVRDAEGSYPDCKMGYGAEVGKQTNGHFARVSATIIKNYEAKILQDPQSVFEELPLYTQLDSRKYQCRLCRERRPTRAQVMRHNPVRPVYPSALTENEGARPPSIQVYDGAAAQFRWYLVPRSWATCQQSRGDGKYERHPKLRVLAD